jgi:hypothetical protein
MKQAQHLTLAALALSLMPTFAVAERNLVPTLDRSFDVCPDRPAEPVWMQEIPLRQAYQRVLVQDIYRAQNLERIVEHGDFGLPPRPSATPQVIGKAAPR